MKKNYIILALLLAIAEGCASVEPAEQRVESMSIIAIPERKGSTTIREFVKLKLPYGMIVSNGDKKSAPEYYLFYRDKKAILRSTDVDALLEKLEALPNGATIDIIGKCTVPFCTEYGVNIDEQCKKISALLDRKRFKIVSSLEDDERHASFCYCETGFMILDKPRESEQANPAYRR